MDPEEAFISALFHNLGRILVALYLPVEMDAIKNSAGRDQDERRPSSVRDSPTQRSASPSPKCLNLPSRSRQAA